MFLTQIDTSTVSNQNLSAALLVHTFTNTTRKRKIYISVDCDQIAGNGAYSVYVTIQRSGAGSAFRAQPTTSATVASGVTSVSFESIPLIVGATDVVKVYVTGLAGDTTTPDITTYVDEEYILTDSSGNVTFSNTSIATVTTATNVTTVNGLAAGAITAAAIATDAIDADAIATDAANEVADALLDRANGVETSVTPRGALRLVLAALAGKLSGAATSTVTIRNVGDSKNRITATVDSDGNRSAVTTDVT